MVHFTIADQGHGIPADQLERIFDRFHQVSPVGRRRKGGTGLGLAICREITEHHGGRIWAESRPAGGSTFHITLPRAAAAAPQPAPTRPAASPETTSPGGQTHA
jgi:signal transduction histidine kinase